ncbi:HgcAB-like fusion protein [Bradyrhizobium sp. Ai1a-2]|uniref:HgcAB-like fusion protein n=1 Tax=Bradyrhizobium sp. Ai1a-2 TaxID=196490 RepID=UPI0004016417|nr:HgcAB-like fusion protein [Bradyrhizobium sp. Ai1a-2]
MMTRIKDLGWELFHIFFRHFNFPCKLGLINVGTPGENSPVFLSGNYTLTVQRVLRKLRGIDCYLLVANSRGSNVWCAAGMNEFSEYDVIDAINVANLGNLVKHRRIIAPVYSAPGVDISAVKRETGFNIKWGPTHLDDLPRFIAAGFKRTNDMFQVKFGLQDRLEQAVSTAWCYTMTIALIGLVWPIFFFTVSGLIFFVYLFGFTLYPLFPEERHWRRTLTITALLTTAMALWALWSGWATADFLLWEGVLVAVCLLMAMDCCGSTPLHKSTIKHWLLNGDYNSHFSPVIDPSLCINCVQCILVCPCDVFAARRDAENTVVVVKPDRCEECLACFKQCPTDAIFNRSGEVKGDVKSIPNLEVLAARDWSHLKSEDRWIGAATGLRGGLPIVLEGRTTNAPTVPPRRAASESAATSLIEIGQ